MVMTYTPYYPGGWANSPAITTPIVAAALQNMEVGIGAAALAGVIPWQPWQFHVSALGGGQDDTPNLRAAIAAAAAYMAANNGYAEIWVDPVVYTLSSALSTAGSGYAQLPMPLIGNAASSGVLVVRCTSSNGAANPYFAQTVAQTSGAVFRSTLTAQAYSGTFGAPTILGGPTFEQGYGEVTGVYDNLMVVLDGITFQPQMESSGPTMAGAWFAGISKAQVISGAYIPYTTIATMNSTQPVNTWANALYMPQPLNNDNCVVFNWTAYGAYRGLVATSHTTVHAARSIYCNRAFSVLEASDGHSFTAGNLSAELCNWGLYSEDGSTGHPIGINVGMLDCEQLSHYSSGGHVNDTANVFGGRVNVNQFDGSALAVTGAANLEIIATAQARAVQSAPSYTLGTAFQNPWWRHATLTVAGGTVTGISVGPTSGSLTSLGITTGTFRLPSGWWVDIAGSVKPTTFIAVPD